MEQKSGTETERLDGVRRDKKEYKTKHSERKYTGGNQGRIQAQCHVEVKVAESWFARSGSAANTSVQGGSCRAESSESIATDSDTKTGNSVDSAGPCSTLDLQGP